MYIFQHLNYLLNSAEVLHFNHSSKIILFSDCHRGDNSLADDFSYNHSLFLDVLNHYYDRKFIYIELGDGDDLWKNDSFSCIRRAHSDVFQLIQKFHNENRFYMMFGNHDIIKRDKRFVKNKLYKYYNAHQNEYLPLFERIKVHEALILKYAETPYKILVVHGHQGELFNDFLWPVSRFFIRYIWRQFELLGFKHLAANARASKQITLAERNILHWARANNNIIIAGHTHTPAFPNNRNTQYFNTGSCIKPHYITGIEIENGNISLVKWSMKQDSNKSYYISKEQLAGPIDLNSFFERVYR